MTAEAPPPPAKPEAYECCGRHCDPCIFDYFWNAVGRWEQQMRDLGLDPDPVLAGFGPKGNKGGPR